MIRLKEIAASIGADVLGDGEVSIARVASISNASDDALVFAEDESSLMLALQSSAAAILTTKKLAEKVDAPKPLLLLKQPKLGFARAAQLLRTNVSARGIHHTAVIEDGVVIGKQVTIEACSVLHQGAQVGNSSSIGAGAVIGRGVKIGNGCRIYPRVVIYPGVTLGDRVVVHAGAILGADGFGYVRDAATGSYLQFPQQGTLVIEDDVEIGANTTIDRGALEETRIARGVKIDNLVHIGHNVSVGEDVVIAAQTGISGSSSIHAGAVVGGQVGMGDHASIGEGVIVGSQAGILPHKHLRGSGVVFWGTPAKPLRSYLKELATLTRLTRKGDKK